MEYKKGKEFLDMDKLKGEKIKEEKKIHILKNKKNRCF